MAGRLYLVFLKKKKKKKENRIVCNYRGRDYADIIAIFQRNLRIKTCIHLDECFIVNK